MSTLHPTCFEPSPPLLVLVSRGLEVELLVVASGGRGVKEARFGAGEAALGRAGAEVAGEERLCVEGG